MSKFESDANNIMCEKTFQNDLNQDFVLLPSGCFMMGDSKSPEEVIAIYGGNLQWYSNAYPQHKEIIETPFYLSTAPVTIKDFNVFVSQTHYRTQAEVYESGRGYDTETGKWLWMPNRNWKSPGYYQDENHPVVYISWLDAQEYISWLNSRGAALPGSNGCTWKYSLPTEAQWEYACRAGTQTDFFWGDNPDDGFYYLNASDKTGHPWGECRKDCFSFSNGYSATAPVRSFKPNQFGLYDMLGNVWEWCQDLYYHDNVLKQYPVYGPNGKECRVMRGGAWGNCICNCRCAYRDRNEIDYRCGGTGFRLSIQKTDVQNNNSERICYSSKKQSR